MDELRTKLKKYPSSFDVIESLPTNRESIRKIIDKLEVEMESNEYDTEMQYHRTWNVLSFLYFVLQDNVKAETLNTKVLTNDQNNIIALSNKAWFSIKKCNIKQCGDICKALERLKENRLLNLIAKAEIAFTYSRLRFERYDKATLLYKNVIDECDNIIENETDRENQIPIDYLCAWMYGYALVQKRFLNASNIMDETKVDISPDTYHRVIQLYCRIITLKESNGDDAPTDKDTSKERSHQCSKSKSNKLVRRYRARAYVDVGLLRYGIEEMFPFDIQGIFTEDLDLPEEGDAYFTNALRIFPNDAYVLERSGQYFRYTRNIERSIELLTNAVEMKGSSFAYHHLALSLRRKLDIDTGNVKHKSIRAKFKDLTNKTDSTIWLGKSPLKPKRIDYKSNEKIVDTIIQYLDQAFETSNNIGAKYDKGLFYRQLNEPVKALEIFEYLIKNEYEHSSRLYCANAYEQAGLCIHDMLEKHQVNDENKEGMEYKLKMYLKSSIEISCNLVKNIPDLADCWKSAPTLHAILLGEASAKDNKEDLLFLYNKLQRHKEALQVLNELEIIAETEDENIKIIQEKVKKYLILGRYDDAVMTLNMPGLLPNGLEDMDETLCRKVYIEAGMDALKKGHDEIARGRIRNSLELGKRNTSVTLSSPNGKSLEEEYDLFILCSIDDDDKGRQLLNIMNRVGLNTTLNIDRQLPGTSVLAGMTDGMNMSKHFLIVVDFDAEDESVAHQMQHLTERLQAIVEERKRGTSRVMVIKPNDCDKVPDMFLGYKTIDMELQLVTDDFTENESMCASVKEILEFLV